MNSLSCSCIITCRLDNLPEDDTTWDRFDAMTDEEIDYSDDPPTDFAFWEGAEIVISESQQLVQLCIDKDVLDWFREKSEDYFTHINAVLRNYVQAHR